MPRIKYRWHGRIMYEISCLNNWEMGYTSKEHAWCLLICRWKTNQRSLSSTIEPSLFFPEVLQLHVINNCNNCNLKYACYNCNLKYACYWACGYSTDTRWMIREVDLCVFLEISMSMIGWFMFLSYWVFFMISIVISEVSLQIIGAQKREQVI